MNSTPETDKSKVAVRVEQWTQQAEQVRQRIAQLQQEMAQLQQQAVMLDGALQAYQCFVEDTTPEAIPE